MSAHTPFNWMEHLGFEVQEAGGVPVINEEGDMREADLCHRVLWDEMVSVHTERESLRAVNADLLAALTWAVEYAEATPIDMVGNLKQWAEVGRAAIARATAQTGTA